MKRPANMGIAHSLHPDLSRYKQAPITIAVPPPHTHSLPLWTLLINCEPTESVPHLNCFICICIYSDLHVGVYVSLCTTCVPVLAEARRSRSSYSLELALQAVVGPPGCWEPSPGLLEKPQLLFNS